MEDIHKPFQFVLHVQQEVLNLRLVIDQVRSIVSVLRERGLI
jgi:hypothetical protein